MNKIFYVVYLFFKFQIKKIILTLVKSPTELFFIHSISQPFVNEFFPLKGENGCQQLINAIAANMDCLLLGNIIQSTKVNYGQKTD